MHFAKSAARTPLDASQRVGYSGMLDTLHMQIKENTQTKTQKTPPTVLRRTFQQRLLASTRRLAGCCTRARDSTP